MRERDDRNDRRHQPHDRRRGARPRQSGNQVGQLLTQSAFPAVVESAPSAVERPLTRVRCCSILIYSVSELADELVRRRRRRIARMKGNQPAGKFHPPRCSPTTLTMRSGPRAPSAESPRSGQLGGGNLCAAPLGVACENLELPVASWFTRRRAAAPDAHFSPSGVTWQNIADDVGTSSSGPPTICISVLGPVFTTQFSM